MSRETMIDNKLEDGYVWVYAVGGWFMACSEVRKKKRKE